MQRFVLSALSTATIVSTTAVAAALEPFEFEAKFEPAFLPKSHLTLRAAGNSAKLTISVSGESVSVSIDDAVAAEFLRDASHIPATKQQQTVGLDGIDVQMQLKVADKQVLASKVWSPTKESAPTEDALIRALYKVTEHSRVPSSHAEYLEHLFGYFDDVQPRWKVVGGTPFIVRFYAGLSSGDIPAFRSLVASLPSDEDAIFDITNLASTGTLFYDEFVKATRTHRIRWKARAGWAEELVKMGIPKERIIHTMTQPP